MQDLPLNDVLQTLKSVVPTEEDLDDEFCSYINRTLQSLADEARITFTAIASMYRGKGRVIFVRRRMLK